MIAQELLDWYALERSLAHTYALEFLQPLVKRGDSLAKVSRYPCPHSCAMLYTLQIGGEVYYHAKRHQVKKTQLVVKEMAKEPCFCVFELATLFEELGASVWSMPMGQLSLWEVTS